MITVVSHDAGGAEILSSYVRQQSLNCFFVLDGPARKIFERKLGSIKNLPLEEAVRQSESILCGTSWQSDIEYEAIKLARLLRIKSVAFLDHWVNYRERFIRSDKKACFPDEVWVGDALAEDLAKKVFSNIPIRLVENPYFQDIRKEYAKIQTRRPQIPDEISVLYVCEPLREHAFTQYGNERHWGYIEEEALSYFLSHVEILGKPIERIVIRPHPSERVDKYDWVKSRFDLPIMVGGKQTLIEEIAKSDVVVGCESMAMVIGLLSGKRVLSCIPPGGKTCSLPQQQIEHLQSLIR